MKPFCTSIIYKRIALCFFSEKKKKKEKAKIVEVIPTAQDWLLKLSSKHTCEGNIQDSLSCEPPKKKVFPKAGQRSLECVRT